MIAENHLQQFACRYISIVLPTIVGNTADIYRQFCRQLSANKSNTATIKIVRITIFDNLPLPIIP
jgi:hypothetical protein